MKILVPLILGAFMVAQAGINEKVMDRWGITGMIWLNSCILLSVSVAVWTAARLFPDVVPDMFILQGDRTEADWWFLLPGLFGFCVVALTPLSFHWIGAGRTVVFVLCAQILVGLVWESVMQGRNPQWSQILGALLVASGGTLTALRLGDS